MRTTFPPSGFWCVVATLPSPYYIPPTLSYRPSHSHLPYLFPDTPPIMVSTTICKILPDHYKVQHAEGLFAWNSVVQDYEWGGVLVIRRFVAENEMEVVAESKGRDENGRRIVRFLVLDKTRVDNLERCGWGCHKKLPRTLNDEWYQSRGRVGDCVPMPFCQRPSF